ncbi:MAG: RNA polymerase factor sigma-54 [Firmicutes bacterium]|nr:RNA polymerase factor sigma-54 [Bacillota bacterium]
MNKQVKTLPTPGLELRQTQQLTLTPALKQSLHILTMPALELNAYIRDQVEQNPVLEFSDYQEAADTSIIYGGQTPLHNEYLYAKNRQDFSQNSSSEPPFLPTSDRDIKPLDINNFILAKEEPELISLLRLQLAMKKNSALVKGAAEQIIECLDEDGYFSLPLSSLAAESGYSELLLAEALALVQSLEPPGVGAQNLRECLCLQISAQEPERELLFAIIKRHLPDVAANRVHEAARSLKTTNDIIENAFRRIRSLTPYPAAHLQNSSIAVPYIIPDIIIQNDRGEFQVLLNDHILPDFHINSYYQQKNFWLFQDKETGLYIKHALAEAENLLRNIKKRRQTVYRLALFTVERQSGFFTQGLAALLPLSMKEAGKQLSLHISTISRAVAGKYIQTPRGMYPWKFFFPRAQISKAGAVTQAWAKEQLKEVIAKENKTNPLSDMLLTEIMKERGIYLARRTITKYREELGIQTQRQRRRN